MMDKIMNKNSKIFYSGETDIINKFLKKKGKKIKFSKLFVRPSYIISDSHISKYGIDTI